MNHKDFKLETFLGIEDEGMSLRLWDGTKWNVNPRYISTVLTWVPGATIRIRTVNEESFYSHSLYNTGTGDSVKARKA